MGKWGAVRVEKRGWRYEWEGRRHAPSSRRPTHHPPTHPPPNTPHSVTKHGPVFASHLVGTPCIVVTSAPDIDAVMLGEHTVTEWWTPPSFVRLLGSASDASVMADKAAHTKRRRQQATAFTPAALASYAPRVEAATRGALARWEAACSGGGSIELVSSLSDLTFEYAEATVVDLGLDAASAACTRERWTDFNKSLFSIPIDLPGIPFRRDLRARDDVKAALAASVTAYKAAFDAGGVPPSTMVSYYMSARAADGDPLSTTELADTALGFLLAGYETSHSAHIVLLGLLPFLAPRVRAALEAEQRAVVATHGDALTAAALDDMKYADALSKEYLRILGPAEGLFRRAKTDFALGGRLIKAGDVLYTSALYAKATDPALMTGGIDSALPPPHMDANAAAAAIVPERWLTGSEEPAPAAGARAFGVGRHSCLGAPLYSMEAKALIAVVVREYNLSVDGDAAGWAPSWAAQAAAFRKGVPLQARLTKRADPIVAAGERQAAAA